MQPSSIPPSPPADPFIPDEHLSIGQYMGRAIGQTVVGGTAIGGIRYVIVLGFKHFFPETWGVIPRNGLKAAPFFLNGFLTLLVWKTIKLVCIIALRFLGKRPQTIDLLKKETVCDRFRCYSWKVIFYLEGIHKKVDEKFSKFFRIRTLEEIKTQEIKKVDLFTLEIFRKVCIEHFQETFNPQNFFWSSAICEFVGFIPIGDRLLNLTRLAVIVLGNTFLGGLVNKLHTEFEPPKSEGEQPSPADAAGQHGVIIEDIEEEQPIIQPFPLNPDLGAGSGVLLLLTN